MARLDRADSADMSEEGSMVRARRERLGLTIEAMAREAGVSRDTLSDMESGTKDFRQLTLAKVKRALDQLEQEAGIDAPPPAAGTAAGVVRFTVQGVYGAKALVVEGPIDDIAELEASVDRIMRKMAADEPQVEVKGDLPDEPTDP